MIVPVTSRSVGTHPITVDLGVSAPSYDQFVTMTSLIAGPPCYGLDIETDTTVNGLDSSCSAIVGVAVATAHGDQVFMGDEADILHRVDAYLSQLDPGLIVTWNGSSFDMPFISDRAELLDVHLGLRSYRAAGSGHVCGWWGHRHLDGYRLYRADVARLLGVSCGLKPLSRMVGLTPVEVDRTRIHELDAEEIRAYVASDARLARELVLRRMPAAQANIDPAPSDLSV